jgi:hypothetical protein
VIFWTDFSAGRKTPLEVTTLFAHTETRAEALVKKLIEENVTKGFDLVGAPKSSPAPSLPEAEPVEAKPKKKAAKKNVAE